MGRDMQILHPGPDQIAYTLQGPPGAAVLMFSNSLGTTMHMWQAQAEALSRRYRVLCYDTRGHGASGGAGICTLDQLGGDVLRLLDALGIKRVSFCGISMGGLTGLWLAVHARERLQLLTVANSAANIGTPQGWTERARQVAAHGMDMVADGAAARWFTPGFRAQAPGLVAGYVEGLRRCAPAGYAGCCAALAQADLRPALRCIDTPTLLMAGLRDEVTTVADADFLRDQIPDAAGVTLDAAHLSNIEAASRFTQCLQDFMG